jgi:hypothetical protein
MTTLLILNVASGALLMALSLPLLWGKIPPNGLYGFRVRATLENPSIWYAAQQVRCQAAPVVRRGLGGGSRGALFRARHRLLLVVLEFVESLTMLLVHPGPEPVRFIQ